MRNLIEAHLPISSCIQHNLAHLCTKRDVEKEEGVKLERSGEIISKNTPTKRENEILRQLM